MLLKIAKSQFGQFVVGIVFARLSFLLPVRRVYNSKRLLAFQHPKPGYAAHYLIVPKQRIRSLADLKRINAELLLEIIKCADHIAERLGIKDVGARLVLNAGAYQEVPQLHFHLIAETVNNNAEKRKE